MALAAGQRLGGYEIVRPLGAGGMGVVYEARDVRLGRRVAIKLLPELFALDPQRLARFDREARAVAAVNHPNIVTLYSAEQAEGVPFLVMELVSGRPLSDLIPAGGLPVKQLLEIAQPLADALAAAHERGIVHRDLKPANVMIDDESRVKVLDFGVAAIAAEDDAAAPTRTLPALTEAGRIIGTPACMAPEQIRSEKVDARADIFAFGVLLYHMASGRAPFSAGSVADTMSAVLREDPPPLEGVRPDLPPALIRLARRCLEKDVRHRLQSSVDVAHQLEDIAAERGTRARPAGRQAIVRRRRSSVLAAGSLVLVVAAGAAVALFYRPRPAGPPASRAGIHSIAVLPLANLMNDASQDYFVDGLHDAIITNVAKLGIVAVTSRSSVMKYKNATPSPLEDIARELGVDALVEGSVLRSGERVRINVQLIVGSTDEHVWADTYDGDLRDVLGLLDDVSYSVARAIGAKLEGAAPHPRIVPEAYDAYLQGQRIMRDGRPSVMGDALAPLERAVALDPDLASAWSSIAAVHFARAFFELDQADRALPLARAAAEKALRLDDRGGEAYGVLGTLDLYYDWKFESARRRLERAVVLSPHSPLVRHAYADYLGITGHTDESLAQLRVAAAAEPSSPLVQYVLAFHLAAARHFDEVLAALPRLRAQFPAMRSWAPLLAETQWNNGMHDAAIATELQRFEPESEIRRAIEKAMRAQGPRAAMRVFADVSAKEAGTSGASAVNVASLYALAGDPDAVFPWLERAYASHTPQLLHIVLLPSFDALRSDPRYVSLIQRIGIPQPSNAPAR